ncbi:methionyl-tRNA formyltransferase [bacterium]|nr:methionyl-tRNA formyltransferase [bacterium]
MRVLFMGSPQFAVPSLDAVHSSAHDVVAVVTQPDRPVGRSLKVHPPPVKVSAQALGIPVLQPPTTKSPEFIDQISAFGPDILVVVAYGEILRKNVLELPPAGAVNLHASLLPKYRGAAPIPWAIINGETETGCTTMQMTLEMDAGPLYLQEKCVIHPSDTTETLSRKLSELGAPLLTLTLDLIEKNAMVPVTQDLSAITFAPKLKKENGRVDWNRPADWISRQIRAFDPWPGTFSRIADTELKLWLAQPVEGSAAEKPGTIINVLKHAIFVACGEGTILQLLEVQPESRPRMTAHEFAIGYRIKTGDSFSDGASQLPLS